MARGKKELMKNAAARPSDQVLSWTGLRAESELPAVHES
jgi:hypothetical protein